MTDSSGDRNPVELLAEEFVARKRRGEKPTLSEYTEKYPDLAEEIREVFPALLMMEDLGDSLQGPTGPHITGGLTLGQIADYRILREVGRGGMGVVFEAEQLSLGRRVALKVLPSFILENEPQLRRFEREARAAARLHHTNIVPVFGVGHHEGTHYYVMQFIQGLGLDGVIQELRRLRARPSSSSAQEDGGPAGRPAVHEVAQSLLTGVFQPAVPADEPEHKAVPFPETRSDANSTLPRFPEGSDLSNPSGSDRRYWRSVARIGVQVAEALEHAHSQGVLHRDVKPSNLLMDTKGTVWVTDFGLAKTGEEDALTETGDVVGTLRYMAPERFRTAGDVRSDVYSLGLTLYELLALRPAFDQRDRPQLMQAVLHGEPPRLRDLSRAVPRDLATIIHKAMAKEPRQRYARAADLAADLQRFLEDRPIQARPIGNLEVLLKWFKRRPAIAVLLALVLLVSLAGLAAFGWQYAEALRENENAQKQAHLKDVEAQLKEEALEQAQQHAQDARQKEKTALEKEGIARRSLDSLKRTLFTAQLVRAGSLAARDPEAARELLEDAEACPPAMRDFSWAFVYGQASRSRWALPDQAGAVDQLALSADGKTLATHYDAGPVTVWDLDSASVRLTLPGTWSDKTFLLLSPDGKVLTTCATEWYKGRTHPPGLERWDTATGRSLGRVQPSVLKGIAPALSRDGHWLAAAGDRLRVWEVSEAGYQERAAFLLPPLSTAPQPALALSPDGRTVALASDKQQETAAGASYAIILWDVAARKERLRLDSPANVTGLVFSDDGRVLYAASGSEATRWDATTGKRLEPLEPSAAQVIGLELSADGKILVGGGSHDGATIWDLQNGKVRTLLRSARAPLALSPDGATLVSLSPKGAVLCWDLSSEAAVPAIKDWKPTVDRRGRRLVTSFTPDAKYKIRLPTGVSIGLGDARTGQPSGAVNDLPRKHEVVFSSDGKTMAILANGDVFLCDSRTGKDRGAFATRAGDLAFSPEGSFCVAEVGTRTVESAYRETVVHSHVHGLKIWDMAAGKPVALLNQAQGPVVFSADGKLLAGVEGEPWSDRDTSTLPRRKPVRVKVWETTTGQERASLAAAEPLAFGPDGRTLIVRGGTFPVPVVWDLAAGRQQFALEGVDLRQSSPAQARIVVDESKAPAIHSEKTDVMGQTVNLALSPDGKSLASASAEGNVILWDVARGTETLRLRGHCGPVLAIVFGADGRMLATAGEDRTVRLWDVRAGRQLHTLRGHTGRIVSLSFHAGATVLASREDEATVKLWNVASGREYQLRGGAPACAAAALSPDGQTLATASGQAVDLWDARSGQRLGALEGHAATVTKLSFSADGQALTSESPLEVKQWNWKTRTETAGHLMASPSLSSCLLSPDGRTLLLREEDVLTLRQVQGGDLRGRMEGVMGLPSFAPDGNRFAVAAQLRAGEGRMKPVLRLGDAAGARELAVIEGAEGPAIFSADGKVLASRAQGPALVLWNAVTGREQARLPGDWAPESLSPAGNLVLVRKRDRSLALWRPADSKEPKSLPEAVLPAAFAADGKTLATAGPHFAVRLWDTSSDRPPVSLEGHTGALDTLIFAADGATLCSVAVADSALTLKLWDVAGRRERGCLNCLFRPFQKTVVIDPPLYAADGKTILWNALGSLRRLEVGTGKEAPAPPDIQGTLISAVSPDGRRLVVSRGVDYWLFDLVTARSQLIGNASAEVSGGSWWFTSDGKKVIQNLPQPGPRGKAPPARSNGHFLVFDAASGREEAAYSLPLPRAALVSGEVPAQKRIQVRQGPTFNSSPILVDAATGRQVGRLEVDGTKKSARSQRTSSPAGPAAFSSDGKLLATAEDEGWQANLVQVWDVADGTVRETWRLGRSGARIVRLMFRPDGHMLFALTERELHRCDPISGKVESIGLPLGGGQRPVLRNDGKRVAYVVADEVRLFDVESDTSRTLVKMTNVAALEMAPDGRFLAVLIRSGKAPGYEMRVFDLESDRQLWSVKGSLPYVGSPLLMVFSADGRTCASHAAAFKIEVWDAQTGRLRGTHACPGSLSSFALSPDGKSIAVHTATGVSIREVATGEESCVLPSRHTGTGFSLHFSPDGKTLFISPPRGIGAAHFMLWSPAADTLRVSPSAQVSAHSLAVSPDGKRLAVGGSPHYPAHMFPRLTVLDTKTGRDGNLGLWQAGAIVSAFSPDGMLLAFAGEQSTLIRLWDFQQQALRSLPRNHVGGVLALAFSPNGKTLASAGKDQAVRLWNVSDGKQTAVLDGLTGTATTLGFSSDGKLLVSAVPPWVEHATFKLIPGEVRVWDVAAAKQHSRFTLADRAGCLALSSDAAVLALADTGGKVTIWDVRAGKERTTLAGSPYIFSVAFSPDGKSLATMGQNDPPRLWDWATGREHRRHFRWDPAWSLTGRGTSLAFSADGKTLYVGCQFHIDRVVGGEFRIARDLTTHAVWHYDVATGKDLGPFGADALETPTSAPARSQLVASAVSDDSKTLVCAWSNGVDVCDMHATPGSGLVGRLRATLRLPPTFYLRHLALRADGKVAAAANSTDLVYLWDTQANRQVAFLKLESKGPIAALQFSSDGKWLAVATGKEVRLFDGGTGTERGRLTGPSAAVAALSFRSAGGALLSRSTAGEVHLWDLSTGKELLTLRGRPAPLAIQGLEPDGKTALTRALEPGDGSTPAPVIRRWDLATGREVGRVEAVASNRFFSPDQRTRLTFELDSGIRLLDPTTSQERFRLPLDSRLQEPQFVFSSDGRRLAVVARESSSPTTGKKFSPQAGPRLLQIWDLPTARLLASHRGILAPAWRPPGVYSPASPFVVFSPDSRLAALVEMDAAQAGRPSSVGDVRVLDLATGKAGPTIKPGKVTTLAFSARDRTLATGGGENVHLWDVASGKEVRTLARHPGQNVHVVGFAAEDSLLVLFLETPRQVLPEPKEESHELVLWDPTTDQLRASLKGARLPAALSPNGRSIATVVGHAGSWGGHLIQVWDVFTAQQRALLRGHRAPIRDLRFTPDGEALISHAWDGIFRWQSTWPNPAAQYYLEGAALLWKQQPKLQNIRPSVDLNINLVLAAKSFARALEIQPDHRGAYAGLARALSSLEKVPSANRDQLRSDLLALLRQLVQSCPDRAEAHFLLAGALEGDSSAGALEQYRQTIRCNPRHAEAHARVGYLALGRGQEEDALVAFQHVVEIDLHALDTARRASDPAGPQALRQVARLFERHGRWADAVAVHRCRVAAASNDPRCQLDLAHALRCNGQRADALSAYRRCQQLDGKPRLHAPERWAELERKLPAAPHSRIDSSDADELLALADLSLFKLRAPTAARCYAAALAAKPTLTSERFNAACAAVLAGTKADQEAAGLSEAERAVWRRQALDWLRVELAALEKALQSDVHQAAAPVYSALTSWWTEADLSAVRDRLQESRLPKEEQAAWTAFWSAAETLRLRAAFVPTGLWQVDGKEIAQQERKAVACWLWLGDTGWTDYDLEVEAQRAEGSEGFSVGFRIADRDNYLLANFGGWDNRRSGVEVMTEGDVKVHWTSAGPQNIETGCWYRVRVQACGDRFLVLLDDVEVLSCTEPGHRHGAVGLRSWNTANRFRNLRVTDPRGKVLFEGLPLLPGVDRIALARLRGQRHRYREAADLFAAAFAANPALATGPDRYNAACWAVRAGTEAAGGADRTVASLRRQAHDWLRAELEARRAAFEKAPSLSIARDMALWEHDEDFQAVRDRESLPRLPAAEADQWKKLWADVADLRRRAERVGGGRTWKIEGNELVQESERGEQVLLFGDPRWRDYDVQLEARPTRGAGELNVLVRVAGLHDMTAAILGGWNNTRCGIMPMVGAQRRRAIVAPGKTTPERWQKVKVEVRGRVCRLLVNGAVVVESADVPVAAGQIGLRTLGTAGRFRNIKVTDPQGKILFEGLPK